MCFSHPKPPPPSTTTIVNQAPDKNVIYMQNSWLDGLGINGETMGRNSLRIDLGTPAPHAPMRTGGPLGPSLAIGGGLPPGRNPDPNNHGHGNGGYWGGGGGTDRFRGLVN